jgi:hypothetical protein
MTEQNKLNILWTNGDAITGKLMVFMYALHAKEEKWWDDVEIILWGATVKLVAEDEELQSLIKKGLDMGVQISACRACSRELGLEKEIEALGVNVDYMGMPLTNILKNNEKLLTI